MCKCKNEKEKVRKNNARLNEEKKSETSEKLHTEKTSLIVLQFVIHKFHQLTQVVTRKKNVGIFGKKYEIQGL